MVEGWLKEGKDTVTAKAHESTNREGFPERRVITKRKKEWAERRLEKFCVAVICLFGRLEHPYTPLTRGGISMEKASVEKVLRGNQGGSRGRMRNNYSRGRKEKVSQ